MAYQRMTRQRRVILEELRGRVDHPSAEELFNAVRSRLPRVSLGTIYRNLDTLVQGGEVRKLEFSGSCARYDADLRPHLHVHCEVCGTVADVFADPPGVEALLPPEAVSRFTVTGYRLEFEGICGACRNASNESSTSRN
jgi:Fur family ferric uptake transcriptional regulator